MTPNPRRPSTLDATQIRALTGVTASQFAELVAELGPKWEKARHRRLTSRERVRDVGAGRRYEVPFGGRLFLSLVYLRHNVGFRGLGAAFGVGKDTVNRAVTETLPLLSRHGITSASGRRIRTEEDLLVELEDLIGEQRDAIVDGTAVPVPRPASWRSQKKLYNPHRHDHTMNTQVVADDAGRLLWVSRPVPGATHDLTALLRCKVADALEESGVTVVADKGYLGIGKRLDLAEVFTPSKKRWATVLPDEVASAEYDLNREISRRRVRVEHAIAKLKIRKVLKDYRLDRRKLPDTLRACAALATLPVAAAR